MTPAWFHCVVAFLFGSIIGSFLNVCIHRIPRGESIVFPPSHCPGCSEKIAPGDNIPILSYLLLRGRCRHCGGGISPVYPLVELLTALLFLYFTCRFGLSRVLLPYLIFLSAMIVIFFIDLFHQIIPDVISLPGILVGLALTPLLPHSFLEGVIGVLAGGGFFLSVAVISEKLLGKPGMGGGDIKLAAMMGAFLGWKLLIVAVFLALLTGSAVGIILMALKKKGRRDPIPFGPFLALGGILTCLWGPVLLEWYLTKL